MKKQAAAISALSLVILSFQNCSPAGFATAQSPGIQPRAVTGSTNTAEGTSSPGGVQDGPARNACFQITCVSDAFAASTFEAVSDANGIIARVAPTRGSGWVLRMRTSGVAEAHNCLSDQEIAAGGSPDLQNVGLCQQYAPNLSYAGPLTFAGGYARNFQSCTYDPCNTGRAETRLTDSYVWHWVMAKPQAGRQAVTIQIKTTTYANASPGTFSTEFSLPLGQCISRPYTYQDLRRGTNQTVTYQVCNNQNLISADFAGQSINLDLRAL